MKNETKQKVIFYLTSKFGWLLILLLGKLCSIKFIGRHYWKQLKQDKKPFIFALWHGRIFLPIFVHRNEKISPIVSLHADGEIIAQTLQRLGYKPVRGSSTRGGNEAFHNLVGIINNGGTGAIMPDGPRGPRHQFKPGTIYLAQRTNAHIIPITFSAQRKVEFRSWDRFNLALPFSKAVVIYGKPIPVPQNLTSDELESFRKKMETIMIQCEKKADEYFAK